MSIDLFTRAFKANIKPSARKFVLVSLADYANEEGISYPSIQRLCEKTSLDRKTVINHLKALAESGLIEDTGTRVGKTKQVIAWRVSIPESVLFNHDKSGGETVPKPEQSQNRNSSENGTGKGTENGTVKGGKSTKNGTRNPQSINPQRESPEELPPNLNLAAWQKWIDYRSKSRLRRYTTNQKAIELSELSPDDQMRCVNHSIDNSYAGIFPAKFRPKDDRESIKQKFLNSGRVIDA